MSSKKWSRASLCIHHMMVLHACFREQYGSQYPLEIVQVIIKCFCDSFGWVCKYSGIDFDQISIDKIPSNNPNCSQAKILYCANSEENKSATFTDPFRLKESISILFSEPNNLRKIWYSTDFMRKMLMIRTNNFRLRGGIPNLGLFCKSDKERNFIKIIFDPAQSECITFQKHLEKADDYFRSSVIKNKLFGDRSHKYTYCPIVRKDERREGAYHPNARKDERHKDVYYCKPKFACGPTGTNQTAIQQNGKKIAEVDTVTDICKHISFGCEIAIIFAYHKIWIIKDSFKDTYGVHLVVNAINKISDRPINDEISFGSDSESS
jgi:hypothetical protein